MSAPGAENVIGMDRTRRIECRLQMGRNKLGKVCAARKETAHNSMMAPYYFGAQWET